MAIVHLAENKRHKNGVGRVLCWKNMPVPRILRDMYVNVCIPTLKKIYRYMEGNTNPGIYKTGRGKVSSEPLRLNGPGGPATSELSSFWATFVRHAPGGGFFQPCGLSRTRGGPGSHHNWKLSPLKIPSNPVHPSFVALSSMATMLFL